VSGLILEAGCARLWVTHARGREQAMVAADSDAAAVCRQQREAWRDARQRARRH
jgi:hypothetical protein